MEAETVNEANGTTLTSATSLITTKPWIAAGFKSRDAWRASKGHKTAKAKAEAKVADTLQAMTDKPKAKSKRHTKQGVAGFVKADSKKTPKKLVKSSRKLAVATKLAPKGKKTKKPTKLKAKSKVVKVKKGPAVKDGSLKPVPVAELSARMKKVFLAIPKNDIKTLEYIQDKAFPNLPHKQGSSWTRNQLRRLRVHTMVKMLGGGKYKRIA